MQKPVIEYKTIIINKKNIDAFRMLPGVRGRYISKEHKILIYRYSVSPDLSLSPNDTVFSKIREIRATEPCVLAHEEQHAQNHTTVGSISKCAKNIYEYISLLCMDEASAFTAGILQSKQSPKTTTDVLNAAITGTKEFLQKQDYYLTKYAQFLLTDVVSFNAEKSTSNMIKKNGTKFFDYGFSNEFHCAISKYFTFYDYSLFKDSELKKTKEWQQLVVNIKKIKTACVNRATTITNMITQHKFFGK